MIDSLKKCSICKIPKPLGDFGKCSKRKSGLRSYCKVCGNLRKLKYHSDNPKRYKNNRLYQNYGISLYDYNLMFLKQEGKCLICNTHQNDLKQKLNVDHDHKTNRIRGLLCNNCNRGLGFFKDDLNLLLKAFQHINI